ncbi:MAG: hypothetical protein ACJZ8O_12030 [Pirellulaceae bacterium]
MTEGHFFADPPPSNKVATRITLIITAAIVITPLVFHWLPFEISQWYVASARIQLEQDNQDAANEQVDKGLTWSDNPSLIALKSDWLLKSNQHTRAISLLEGLLKYPLHDPNLLEVHIRLCNTVLAAARSKGKEPCPRVSKLWNDASSIASGKMFDTRPALFKVKLKNARAYQLAVADDNLKQALTDTEEAIEMLGGNVFVLNPTLAKQFNQVEFRIKESGSNKEVAESFKRQVIDSLERSHIQLKYNGAKRWSITDKEYRDETLSDTANWLIAAHKLYLKALPKEGFDNIRQRTNNEIEALSRQLETVRPIAIPRMLNSQEEYLLILQNLDTRGYVHFRLKNYQVANWNLTAAIDLATGAMRELASKEIIPTDSLLTHLQKTLAIMHYHRAMVYEALGHGDFQQRDLDMVRKYGEEPNPILF